MAISQARGKRNVTGSRYKAFRKKKQFELGSEPTMTKIGAETKTKSVRVMGGNNKMRTLQADIVNVVDPKTKKYSKVKIKTSVENMANRHYVRRNILTKGAIIETEKGKARITNRPGQEGVINAVFVK